jgi:phosphoglycerate dehydrogenase-like enzyme
MSWRVLIAQGAMPDVGAAALEMLRQAGCQLVMPAARDLFSTADLMALLPGCDAALASSESYSREVLQSQAAASLKIISRWGVGYDAVDVAAATEAGICVAYVPGLLNEAVADYTFALLCALARRVHEAYLEMTHNTWRKLWGQDLFGKTLGLIGCGRIGLAVAKRAAGFQMRLLAFDPVRNAQAQSLGVCYVALDDLLASSDFVSLHVALTAQTRGLIGQAELKRMKPTALLINTSRGLVLDELALAQALRAGEIAGAALDVFVTEPLPADHIFRQTPNLLLSPHQASWARDTGAKVSQAAAQAIVDLMAGRQPRWVVDPAVFASAKLRARLEA